MRGGRFILSKRIVLILQLLLLMTLATCKDINSLEAGVPTAKEGIIDLRIWDFENSESGGSVNLNGEWDFYPEKLGFTECLLNEARQFYVFGDMNNIFNKQYSYASFKLRLLLPENFSENALYIRIKGLNGAYILLSSKNKNTSFSGNPGNSKTHSISWIGSKIEPLQIDSSEVDLYLRVSDFHSLKIGFNGTIEIGTLRDLENLYMRDIFFSLNLIMLSLFILIYSLAQIKEENSFYLFTSSLCLIYLLGITSPYPLLLFIPGSYDEILIFFKSVSEFGLLVNSCVLINLTFSNVIKNWVRITSKIFFVILIFVSLMLFHLPLPLYFEKICALSILLVQLIIVYRFIQYGPSSIARMKTYIQKYKTDLDKTLKELQDNKKSFDQKLIDRSFNLATYMEKLEIQTGEMEKLNELIVHLLEGANIDEVLDEIFSHIMTYYRANIAFLYFIDQNTNEFYPYRGITKNIPDEIRNFMSSARMPVSKEAGASYIAYKRKKTIYFENAKTKYTRKKEKTAETRIPELISSLYIPVLIRNEFQGIFFLATFNHKLNLNKDKIKFISMFTNQLTAAIQKEKILNAMEEEKSKAEREREKAEAAKLEAETAKQEIEAINGLARSINENLELKAIMKKIMSFVDMHYGIKFYSLYILNDSKKKMNFLEAKFPENISFEEKRNITQISIPIDSNNGVFSFICKTKKMIFYKKLILNKSNEEEKQALGNLNISSMVGIPLKVKNEIIGILNLFSQSNLNLSKTYLKTIANLGEQVAGVIHNSSLYKDIKIEKDKSESLLLSILPPAIATELKNTSKVVPVIYDSVTILFTDFVGFTKIAESLLPKQLLIELDGYFTFFDFICEKYNMEKLKTIGDSYMCAGGLPTANKTHALDACLTALEFREFALRMQEVNLNSKNAMMPWELRIGLHTGPVIGGVVGSTKFAYDVWGDSVNIASRMESSSIPGKINISGATYQLVKDFFICDHRGKVSAKNKGQIRMYYLNRLKPEFSSNEEGTMPNQKFHELYEKIKTGENMIGYFEDKIPVAV